MWKKDSVEWCKERDGSGKIWYITSGIDQIWWMMKLRSYWAGVLMGDGVNITEIGAEEEILSWSSWKGLQSGQIIIIIMYRQSISSRVVP